MGILKLHPANIGQLKGHIKHIGPAVIHGDGNIYPDPAKDWTPASGIMNHSFNNATFSNPDREEAKYYKAYYSVDEVPNSVEELEKQLIANKFATAQKNADVIGKPVTNTFAAYEDEDDTNAAAEKKARKIFSVKAKLESAIEKANTAKTASEAEGAKPAVIKAAETAQAKVDELTKELDALTAE